MRVQKNKQGKRRRYEKKKKLIIIGKDRKMRARRGQFRVRSPEGGTGNLYRLLPPLVGPAEATRAISFRVQSGLLMRLMGVQLTRAAASRRDELFGGAPQCPPYFPLPPSLPLVLYRAAEIYGRCPPAPPLVSSHVSHTLSLPFVYKQMAPVRNLRTTSSPSPVSS